MTNKYLLPVRLDKDWSVDDLDDERISLALCRVLNWDSALRCCLVELLPLRGFPHRLGNHELNKDSFIGK